MRLTDDELHDVLARAEEIQRTSRHGHEMQAELEAVIAAAAEVGLTRPAVERALRERFNLPAAPPAPGTLAFAASADGHFHVAEVLSISADTARVRFMGGSEHHLTPDQLLPCSLIPGARVICNWPWWGPWTCTVISYDAVSQSVELSDGWGSTHTCSLAQIWLAAPRKVGGVKAAGRRGLLILSAGAGLGALIGSIVTALLMR